MAAVNPPHGAIAKQLREGQVIPFLGAGVNFGARPRGPAGPPPWRPTSPFLPSGKELSLHLAHEVGLTYGDARDVEDLAKVASYYVDIYDGERGQLRANLRNVFVRGHATASIHRYLAREALYYLDGRSPYAEADGKRKVRGTPLLVVTTNYDDLTERAFRRFKRPYDLVIYPTDRTDLADSVLWWKAGEHDRDPVEVHPNSLRIDLARTNVIYKMHGSINRLRPGLDSFVITEEDYVDFLSRMTMHGAVPAQFLRHFRNRRFLFLGYGLNDWNLRVVLRNLRTVLPSDPPPAPAAAPPAELNPRLQSWAIQFRPSPLDVALWQARKVRIFDEDISLFASRLKRYAKANLEVREGEV